MSKLNKEEATAILLGAGYATKYMVNIIQSDPRLSARKAKLLKCAAHLHQNGFVVSIATYANEPRINYMQITWHAFEIVGMAFYNKLINAEQVIEVVKKYDVDK